MINRFTGQYAFLSNFHPCTISFEKKLYKTVEHALQASRTTDPARREFIRKLPAPGKAKHFGDTLPLDPAWEDQKLKIMEQLLQQKFENPFLKPLLIATAPEELVFENTWHDHFWGICVCKRCVRKGLNHLGRQLEALRDSLGTQP